MQPPLRHYLAYLLRLFSWKRTVGRGSGNATRRDSWDSLLFPFRFWARSAFALLHFLPPFYIGLCVPSSYHFNYTAISCHQSASFAASCCCTCPCISRRHVNLVHGRRRWLQSAGLVCATASGLLLEPCLTPSPLVSSPTVGFISSSLVSSWGLCDSLAVGALNPVAAISLALQRRRRSRSSLALLSSRLHWATGAHLPRFLSTLVSHWAFMRRACISSISMSFACSAWPHLLVPTMVVWDALLLPRLAFPPHRRLLPFVASPRLVPRGCPLASPRLPLPPSWSSATLPSAICRHGLSSGFHSTSVAFSVVIRSIA